MLNHHIPVSCDAVNVTDDVKASDEPGTEAELLKVVEVVDEVKTDEQDAKTDDKADTSAVDEDQVKNEDETPAELSVDVDKDSKYYGY